MSTTVYERVVTEADTAGANEPRLPKVASTPFVLAIAEGACHLAIVETLEKDELSVGAHASIDHLAPTPVGATLRAEATLVATEGPKFTFDVKVLDGETLAARVRHVRIKLPLAAIEQRLAAAEA